MKKSSILLLIAGLFLSLVTYGQSGQWIKTADEQISCLKINVQKETTKIVLNNGEKKTMPTSTISSYFKDDKLYSKMPLNNGDNVFMEFLRTRDDMSLYKYNDSGTARYFVYKGDDIYMELTDANKSGFEKFFNIQL